MDLQWLCMGTLLLCFSSVEMLESNLNSIPEMVDTLIKLTRELQVTKSTKYIPLIEVRKDKGVYESDVKANFHGPPELNKLRKDASMFDNNMFATAWVTSSLLEACRYGNTTTLTNQQLQMALAAIENHRDKNKAYPHSLMVFWPQEYNATVNTYQSRPDNLVETFKLLDHLPIKALEEVLKWLGFKDLEQAIELVMEMEDIALDAFRIPPDFDDTFVNLGLGSLLYEMKSTFPSGYQQWSSANTNLTSIFDALKRYAYRPFSGESRINTVDPRTYFYLRQYLEDAQQRNADVALVPTWIQDIDETRYMYARGDVMPFNINNVDVTVSANTIYGITAGVLSGVIKPEVLNDMDIQQIYLNTSAMIVHEIRTNMTDRRDLALTYYPSLFECYWFVARTFSLINSKARLAPLPHQAMYTVQQELQSVLQGAMTQTILIAAKSEGQMTYFDDFLGDGDVRPDNQTDMTAEDRIFTTSMAVNALIQAWSVFDEKQKTLTWNKDTPDPVKQTVKQSVAWLVDYTLHSKYKPWNAFFSGSGKGHESMPFWYPINRMEYLNGTKIPDDQHFPDSPWIFGFQGVVPDAKYREMLNEKHFGEKTPMTFPGYNAGTSFFPFWTSTAYTYSTALLALVQYDNLTE